MIIGKGRLTARTFNVLGRKPEPPVSAILESLEAHAFSGFEDEEHRSSGWVSIGHILDMDFSKERNVRGPFVVFGLRVDKRRVPSQLFKAKVAQEIDAALAVQGRVPPRERRDIRQRIKEELLEQVLPSSSATGIVWHRSAHLLHIMSSSRAIIENAAELFDRCFELSLECRGPGFLGLELARAAGAGEAFAALAETQLYADVPSAAKED